ncbi:MAG: type IX secretion system membrane protein PorP/SprF [Cytophagales bacterium]|nr:MAG: type IX secretion system membrane protein PorP/SprF [Cytophagales bacterium]
MKKTLLFSILLISFLNVSSQDIQYSQFYANALYLSPAFAGSNQTSRAILHSRLQWPGIDATYIGTTFSFDHYFPRFKSGVGALINSDFQNAYGGNTYRTLDIGLQYAYQVDLSEEWTFRPAIQATIANRRFQPLAPYGDQMNNQIGQVPGQVTSDPTASGAPSYIYPDFGAGGLLFSKKMWVGLAAHHLNMPPQNFFSGSQRLPIKASLHAGMKFLLKNNGRRRYGFGDDENEVSLSPVMNYKMQGRFDQLDLGAYLRYNMFVVGSWYRGIPFKLYPNELTNNESIVLLVGIMFRGLNIGYSYDVTVSKLARANTGGAHELSITYNFLVEPVSKKKPPKNRKPVCPKF